MAGGVEEAVVFQQRLELDAQQAALGQHGAPLLHVPAEVGLGGFVAQYHGLAEEQAVLGAADVEDIRQRRQVRQGQVISGRGEGGAQTGAVQEQVQAVLVAAAPQGGQLGLRVDGADLCAVGDVHHAGEDHVFGAVVLRQNGLHQSGSQLAVGRIDVADLVARGLDGAGLMGVDVAGVGGDDRLVGLQKRVDDHQIGLGAAHQKVDVGVRGLAQAADQIGGGLAAGVHAVAAGLLRIGVG